MGKKLLHPRPILVLGKRYFQFRIVILAVSLAPMNHLAELNPRSIYSKLPEALIDGIFNLIEKDTEAITVALFGMA